MRHFENEIIAVVGGSSGIGKQTALRFASKGAHVLVLARRQDELQKVVQEIEFRGGTSEAYTMNVIDPASIAHAVQSIQTQYGKVDVLIYGAGEFTLSPVETLDVDIAKHIMDINYWGAVRVTQAFLPLIRQGRRKSLIYISSLSVQCTPAFFATYAGSKHALYGFALSLRQELSEEDIQVGVISPGPVNTSMIAEHVHQDMYPLPLGIPVLTPQAVAKGIERLVVRRVHEQVLPRRLVIAARLSSMYPSLLGMYYRLTIPRWKQRLKEEIRHSKGKESVE